MAAERALRSYVWRVGLLLSLLLADGSRGLAARQPRSSPRLASHIIRPRVKQVGNAAWYGPQYQGKKTASGQRFDQQQFTAAHPTLPLGTMAKVTNLATGQSVQVKINDRGPYAKRRIIDLSRAAAQRIGLKKDGTTRVRVEASPPPQVFQTALVARRHAHKAEKKRAQEKKDRRRV